MSKALWELRSLRKHHTNICTSTLHGNTANHNTVSNAQLDYTNELIHSEIDKLLEKDKQVPYEFSKINIDQLIADTDTKL